MDNNVLKTTVEEDSQQTPREIASRLKVNHITVLQHLHAIGTVKKMDKWVSHERRPILLHNNAIFQAARRIVFKLNEIYIYIEIFTAGSVFLL